MSKTFLIVLFFLLPIIVKSLGEKKQIEQSKYNKPTSTKEPWMYSHKGNMKQEKTEGSGNAQKVETITFDDAQVFSDDDEENKKDRYYENVFEDLDTDYNEDYSIEVEVLQKGGRQKEYNSQDLAEDIVRGVIFSEILSKPKSIENRRNIR